MEAISWRIDDHQSQIGQLLHDLRILRKRFFRRIGDEHDLLFQPIDLGVVSRISDSFFHDLHTDELFSFACFEETDADAAGTAVKIQDRSFDIPDHIHRLTKELLRSERIGLKEREWRTE